MTGTRRGAALTRGARYLAAVALVCTGVLHLQQYLAGYSVIPIIGPLFVANFVLGAGLGLALFAPIERIPRIGPPLLTLTAAGGMAFALGTIAGLEISEFATLFGFHEAGYHAAMVLSLAFEGAAAVLLGVFLVAHQQAGGRYPPRDRDSTDRRFS